VRIQVEQGEYQSVTSPDSINSGAFCTCYAIGVWDRRLRRAHILHDEAPINDQLLPKFLDMVLSESKAVDLTIKVFGGGEAGDEHRDYVLQNRQFVLQTIITDYKLIPIEVRFFDDQEGGDLLITETGEFVLNGA
jgi:hypothetical protein